MQNEELEHELRSLQQDVHPIVPFDPARDKLVSIDLDINNPALDESITGDLANFSSWINEQLSRASARYGTGGYNEHRGVYAPSSVFDGTAGGEPRRLHLGIDIWGQHGTAVMAPLDGIVHSFAFNNRAGDYGGTIILAHRVGQLHFHTLYGHLSLASLGNLQEGAVIRGGDIVGSFGIPRENGGWPPHLHFQVITDMKGWKGDYPGVCKFSERAAWLENSPDPAPLIRW